jgi:RNA polymerase sigma factor (sigma-70 family)
MTDWDQMVRQHGPVVFATAWRILSHAADAEDVVQKVFLQGYQVQQVEVVRCWEALLRQMASYRALDRLRQRRRTVPLDGSPLACEGDNSEEAGVERELADCLRDAIASLPPREARSSACATSTT